MVTASLTSSKAWGLLGSTEHFTPDESRSSAVVEARRLHEAGSYPPPPHVNWCCAAAYSHLRHRGRPRTAGETKGRESGIHVSPHSGMIRQKVPFGARALPIAVDRDHHHHHESNSSEELVVATTRLETMMGDVAVAVHPDDRDTLTCTDATSCTRSEPTEIRCAGLSRYRRRAVDPSTGTGAAEITLRTTPDYACAQRVMSASEGELALPLNLRVFKEDGRITSVCERAAPKALHAMTHAKRWRLCWAIWIFCVKKTTWTMKRTCSMPILQATTLWFFLRAAAAATWWSLSSCLNGTLTRAIFLGTQSKWAIASFGVTVTPASGNDG